MKTNRKTLVTLFAFAMSIILMIACLCMGLLFHANADSKINKLLFVTEENADISTLSAEFSKNSDNTYFETASLSKITAETLNSYVAVALPASEIGMNAAALVDIVRTRIYLYGEVTIADYKTATGLEKFTLQIPMLDIDGAQISMAEQFFDETYEQTEVFAVICHGENALLGSAKENAPLAAYLAMILDNYKQFFIPQTRATIIQSGVNYSTAVFGGDQVDGVIHMNYVLYREFNEVVADYNYFAIQTNTWATHTKGKLTKLYTSYDLPNVADSFIETGPASTNRTSEIAFGISVGTGGVGLSFSFPLNTDANIERDEHIVPDSSHIFGNFVAWTMTPWKWFIFGGSDIGDNKLSCGATWQDKVTGTNNSIHLTIEFSGQINGGPDYQYPISSETKTVDILMNIE